MTLEEYEQLIECQKIFINALLVLALYLVIGIVGCAVYLRQCIVDRDTDNGDILAGTLVGLTWPIYAAHKFFKIS